MVLTSEYTPFPYQSSFNNKQIAELWNVGVEQEMNWNTLTKLKSVFSVVCRIALSEQKYI